MLLIDVVCSLDKFPEKKNLRYLNSFIPGVIRNSLISGALLLSFCGTDPLLYQSSEINTPAASVPYQKDQNPKKIPSPKACSIDNCRDAGWVLHPFFQTDGPIIRFTTVTGSLEEEIIVNFPAYCGSYAVKFKCTGPEYSTFEGYNTSEETPPLNQCYLINDYPLAAAAEAGVSIYYFNGEPGIMVSEGECIALENNVQVLLVSFEPPMERYRGILEFCVIPPDVERPYDCNE